MKTFPWWDSRGVLFGGAGHHAQSKTKKKTIHIQKAHRRLFDHTGNPKIAQEKSRYFK
jgi:hypothetical protein